MLPPGAALPEEGADWIRSGALDSMAHAEVVVCIEKRHRLRGFFDRLPGGPPRSTKAAIEGLKAAASGRTPRPGPPQGVTPNEPRTQVCLAGWGHRVGAELVPAACVEKEHGLPPDTILRRAGIESVARAKGGETELDLAVKAAESALARAGTAAPEVDLIVVTSETFLGLPSLGFALHRRLQLREDCGVLDVGGACAGLVNALFVGSSVLRSSTARLALVVTADVHGQALRAGQVDGRFAGLFGDGASAFVLRSVPQGSNGAHFSPGEFVMGCTAASSRLISLAPDGHGGVHLDFDGGALGRAAVRQLDVLLHQLESRSGCRLESASSFATHQPNPRLLEMLARQSGLSIERFPVVCRNFGNLGSSTAGVALSLALEQHSPRANEKPGPIFIAALGPGLVLAGCVLQCGQGPSPKPRVGRTAGKPSGKSAR
ncbi:MAG TPA: 3-oxoacyl-[acyl-carrier-protein] synthase III C-terminal domain-containing protein [Candidatus Acidoferrales bacterium]|nr:3-oxoacyl-[acyl-carrier-protein] synthase III C-terminal domain-containing protein [Candidatus Acidoferrales bacterium]